MTDAETVLAELVALRTYVKDVKRYPDRPPTQVLLNVPVALWERITAAAKSENEIGIPQPLNCHTTEEYARIHGAMAQASHAVGAGFDEWWKDDGYYYDPNRSESWEDHDKRRDLCEYVWRTAIRMVLSQDSKHDGAIAAAPDPGYARLPVKPTAAMLRPFYDCPPDELELAWQAMIVIATSTTKRGAGNG